MRIMFAMLMLVHGSAWAIVNVESMRIGNSRPGFSSQLSLDAMGYSGNTEKFSVDFGTRFQWQQPDLYRFIVTSYAYGESRDIKDTNNAFAHARWVKTYREKRAWEVFVQVGQDEFAQLNFRGLAGGGLRFTFWGESGNKIVHVGTGAFFENETLDESVVNEDRHIETVRGNIYTVFKSQLNENAFFNFLQYYQPGVEDWNDYRLLTQTALVVKAAKQVNIKLAVDLKHDNMPPAGVEKTDITYSSGIVVEF